MVSKKLEISIGLCFVLPPIGILLLTILSLSTIYRTIKSKKPFNHSVFSLFLLCLFAATVGSVLEMQNGMVMAGSLIVLIYWGIYQTIVTTKGAVRFEQFRWIIIACGLYNCLLGPFNQWVNQYPVIGLLTGTGLMGDTPDPNYARLIGSGYNPNFTVVLLLLALAFLLAELLTRIHRKQYAIVGMVVLMLPILSMGVMETGSRAGFITMVCIYALFFIRLSPIVAAMGSLVLLYFIEPIVRLIPRSTSIDSSFEGRQEIWMNAIEIWEQHPLFGTTQLGFRLEYSRMFHLDLPHAHNMFIGYLAEYGLIGCVALIFLIAITGYQVVNLYIHKRGDKGPLNYFLLGFPVIVCTGILDEPVFSPQIAILAIMLMGFWEKYSGRIHYAYMDKIRYAIVIRGPYKTKQV